MLHPVADLPVMYCWVDVTISYWNNEIIIIAVSYC